MYDFLALVRLDVFDSTLRAPVIAATTPDINPFFAIFRAAIIIHELSFWHFTFSLKQPTPLFLAMRSP
jgi:hypothetical protein